MSKLENRENITTIIHALKVSYAKTFHEKFPVGDAKMEEILNSAAKEAKKRKEVKWVLTESGEKKLEIKERARRIWNNPSK